MNQTVKGIITVLVVAGVGYAAYMLVIKDKKAFYAKKIVAAGKHGNETSLKTLDEPYLKQWYMAVKGKQDSFTYNGATYNTQGGKLK